MTEVAEASEFSDRVCAPASAVLVEPTVQEKKQT